MRTSGRTRASWVAAVVAGGMALPALVGGGRAEAFCGFFVSGADAALTNNASQVALLRKGNRTVLSMSNNYKGPAEDFAMVVPVPVVLQKEDVKTLPSAVFSRVDQLSAPRLVEYWEQDPCYEPPKPSFWSRMERRSYAPSGAIPPPSPAPRDYGVTIEAKFEVGEYQILILSAKESNGLEKWLRLSKYNIPKGAAEALAPYIRDQQKFFVAKVDIKKVKYDQAGFVQLSPLRFSYESQDVRLPVRLGLLNADGAQDLLIYLLHPTKRMEVTNYQNVFVPTNIEVANEVRKQFPSFYAELFDETLRRAGGRAVVTEYAWQTTGCDPCPTPPLSAADLYLLGDDEFRDQASREGATASSPAAPARMPPGGFFGPAPSYVLTRMHTRYDQKTLDADLLFREASPVVGGRANGQGGLGDQGAVVGQEGGGVNNFQGRYIIRHYWEGPVKCRSPRYGVWGGPPGGGYNPGGSGPIEPAKDLANTKRGVVQLPQVITSGLPAFGIPAQNRPLRKGETKP